MEVKHVIKELEKKLFNLDILNENDNFLIKRYLRSKNILSNIINIIENEDYNSYKIFDTFEELIITLNDDEPPEDWMEYFYFYTLNLSYPGAVEIKMRDELEKVTLIFLNIYSVFLEMERESSNDSWLSKYPIRFLSRKEISELENAREYLKFKRHFENEFIYELMKLNQDVIGHSTLDHVSGVHYLALKVARQIKHANIPIDLGRVSGAAAGHDIGKFGCKRDEQHKVAYYHYYYTGQWFDERDITYIRNVAINHSTWDLELENLSLESLVLIYSDFRVKTAENSSEIKFYTLDDAFEVILNKLDNVDDKKRDRYMRVYKKLKDFENFLIDKKIVLDPDRNINLSDEYVKDEKYYSILQGDEVIDNSIYLSIDHNIRLMHKLRNETSLNKLLEVVRSGRDSSQLRGYVNILNEYSTYLTQKQRDIVLEFLFFKLIAKQEDIRKQSASLIGKLISNYDEEIRKELPKSVLITEPEINTLSLFEEYIEKFLYPPQKIIEKHKQYISFSLREMVEEYFKNIDEDNIQESIDILLKHFKNENITKKVQFYLLKLTRILNYSKFNYDQKDIIINFVFELLHSDDKKLKLRAFNALYEIYPELNEDMLKDLGLEEIIRNNTEDKNDPAENYAWFKLAELVRVEEKTLDKFRDICMNDLQHASDIFLSNLKSATYDISKRLQIELLLRNTLLHNYNNAFYAAQHLCNLLKVSALESVRNEAGKSLIKIFPFLTFEQKNDIVIELIRALEMESFEFTQYIPNYLGQLILHLKPNEFDEIIDDFYIQMGNENPELITLFQMTVGVAIENYSNYKLAFPEEDEKHENRLKRILGIILSGFTSEYSLVNQNAFNVLGNDIFQSDKLDLNEKKYLFDLSIKKILSLLIDSNENDNLVFINNCAGLKHVYNFIAEYRFEKGEINLKENQKIAFFPGAFDPFSRSHRNIAINIRDLGFEVYIAVDEFSWSKKTQPNLIRREIIRKSIGKEMNIYIFPKELPINIANSKDIETLINCFPKSDVFLAAGSDVLANASAYEDEDSDIFKLPHIVFNRHALLTPEMEERLKNAKRHLDSKSISFDLDDKYEYISSTQIRNYIDDNRDISELIDPAAQNYIYDKGLYQREPQYKGLMTTKSIRLKVFDKPSNSILEEISKISDGNYSENLEKFKELRRDVLNFRVLILRELEQNNKIIGFVAFHWLRSRDIHKELEDSTNMEYVINNYVGRILVVDTLFANEDSDLSDIESMILTETVSFGISKDYSYCIYIEKFNQKNISKIKEVLELNGFVKIDDESDDLNYAVDMTSPCILNMDIKSMFKEPFKHNENITSVIKKSRTRLKQAITKLFPGKLLISYNRTMLYENLIRKVCEANNVSTLPSKDKKNGDSICVPFGAIFKRWILPNTVTKTLHSEKYFSNDLKSLKIKSAPFYLNLDKQVETIKSFNKEVILVDDLLNKGYRLKVLLPLLKKHNVKINKIITGIMSGYGKALVENKNIDVTSAYFLSNIHVWFYESKLYPFIGGDGVSKGTDQNSKFIQSANMILPYSSARYIKGADNKDIYDLSMVSLENALDIMAVVEYEYQKEHNSLLSLSKLGEVLIDPRFPDKGKNASLDMNIKPSDYLREEIIMLKRLQ